MKRLPARIALLGRALTVGLLGGCPEEDPTRLHNRAPTARVEGTPSQGYVGTPFTLDGSASSEADGDPLTYQWTQTAGPAVTLSNPNRAEATFTPEELGTYVLNSVVNDGHADSAPAEATITVSGANLPPTARTEARPAQGRVGTTFTLDGKANSDPDGDPLTYQWSQAAGPAVTLTDADSAQATFTPKEAGTYVFELVVNDGKAETEPAEATIVVTLADQPIHFPDTNLEAAIRQAIDKPSGDIFQSHVADLGSLEASGRGIADLEGMQYLTALTWMYMGYNHISDLGPLSGLTALRWVHLPSNQISGLAALVENPGLGEGDEVELRDNPPSDEAIDVQILTLEARGVSVYYH